MPKMNAMKRLPFIFGIACSFFAPDAQAAEVWANNRKVTFLYPRDYGYVFQFDGAVINPGSPCEANRVVILTQPNFDSMVATLISAFLNRLRIDVNYDDTTITTCETKVNRIIVRS